LLIYQGYEHQYTADLPYTDIEDANGVTWRVVGAGLKIP
jgi:hypothetical protein